ncbi:HVA22-like protein e [Wolffia australiana]
MKGPDQLWIVLNHLLPFVSPAITLLYPLYESVRAIESPSSVDDEQWLAYWILYSFLTLTEMVAEPILHWVPMWYHVKLAFTTWLVLPQFRGAAFVYERIVREQIHKFKGGSGGGSSDGEGGRRHRWRKKLHILDD